MSETLNLRRYLTADHDAVMAVHRLGLLQAGRDNPPGPWDADLDHIEDYYLPTGDFLVGELEGQIVAIGGLRMLVSHVAELKRMRIHPQYFGRGYDQALLDALTDRARALGARRLVLDIDERRVPAQELYTRNGFVRYGTLLVGRTPSIVFEKVLDPTPSQHLPELLAETLGAASLSGIAAACRHGHEPPVANIVGTDIRGGPLDEQSLFPTASLTKLAVALAVLRLVDRDSSERARLGAPSLELDAPIQRILPEAMAEGATIRRLLSHTAGVPEMPLSMDGSWADIGKSCLSTPLAYVPGTRLLYSNLGYGLLGLILERVTGRSFGEALGSLVFEPLGLDAHVADALPREPVQGWRFRVLPAGGVFMSAHAALGLIEAFRRPPADYLSAAFLSAVLTDQTGGVAGGMGPRLQWAHCPWGLGPEIRGDRYSPWIPRSASASSFGHAGASGCVAWCDPEADLSWVLLTVPPADRSAEVRWHLQRRPNLADLGEAILREQSCVP